jgi:hypothetical protein
VLLSRLLDLHPTIRLIGSRREREVELLDMADVGAEVSMKGGGQR